MILVYNVQEQENSRNSARIAFIVQEFHELNDQKYQPVSVL